MLLEDPYVEAALQAPPSPDYVPSPEHPLSPVYVPYVPEPAYPEFMPPDDDVLLAEEQSLPTAISPTTDSPADYPDDRDDEEEEESSGDDADDEEEDEDKDKDEMSIRYQTPIPFPSTTEVDRFLAISNPPSSPLTSYSSSLPQIPSLPLPVSSPLPIPYPPLPASPTHPLGYRDAMIRLRAESPSISHPLPILLPHIRASMAMMRATAPSTYILASRSETPPFLPIPLPTSSPPLLLPSTDYRADVLEGFRADYGFVGTLDAEIRRNPEREIGYGITNIKKGESTEEYCIGIADGDCSLASSRPRSTGTACGDTKTDEYTADTENGTKKNHRSNPFATTATTSVTNSQLKAIIDQGVIDALAARDADRNTNGDNSHNSGTGVRRTERVARECTYPDFMKTVGHDVVYAMTWTDLKKKMTDKYCPRGEIKKLEAELWNLKVKENKTKQDDNQQQQNKRRRTLVGPTLQDLVRRNLMILEGSKPLYLNGNITTRSYVLPKCHKCKELAIWLAATVGVLHNSTLLKPKGPWAGQKPTCYECGAQGHFKRDYPKLKNNKRGNQGGNGNAPAKVYANLTAFSSQIDITPSTLDHYYDVELADGRIIRLNNIIPGCTLNFLNHPFNIDLMPIELGSLDVIIGMDWLARSDRGNETRLNIISCTKTQINMLKGCPILLAHVTTKEIEDKSEKKRLEDVPII
ncbi:putative reverse transcriptase domain-containing protein [Tanacetum coccineum]